MVAENLNLAPGPGDTFKKAPTAGQTCALLLAALGGGSERCWVGSRCCRYRRDSHGGQVSGGIRFTGGLG